MQSHAGHFFCGDGQGVGSHVGVGNAGGAGGDSDERQAVLVLGTGRIRLIRRGFLRGAGHHIGDQFHEFFLGFRTTQCLNEFLAHQVTGQLRQDLQVSLAGTVGGGDHKH